MPKSSEHGPLAVACRDVTKRFYYYDHRTQTLREWFIRSVLGRPIERRPVFTLDDFNVEIRTGESVALIGANGSGKSTALRLMAGIYHPTGGSVEVRGRSAAIIELGAGFHPELTGAENMALYGAVLGLGRREFEERRGEMIRFAGMDEFIDTPIKYYSSGMEARLAFSVAVCAEPDILLLDEVLAVGDQEFRERCYDRLRVFHDRGGTMILVSHELPQVRKLCSRALWLESGRVELEGDVEAVVTAFESRVHHDRSHPHASS